MEWDGGIGENRIKEMYNGPGDNVQCKILHDYKRKQTVTNV